MVSAAHDEPGRRVDDARETADSDTHMLTRLLTVSTLWPWFYLTFFSNTVLLPADSLLKIEPIFRSVGLGAAALMFLLLLVLGKRVLDLERLKLLGVLVAVGSPWPVVLAFLYHGVTQTYFVMECVAWAAAGVAVACIMFLAHPAPKAASRKDIMQTVGLSFTLGSFVYLVCSIIPLGAARIILLVLPYISLVGLYLNRNVFFSEAWYSDLQKRPRRMLLDSFQAQPSQLVYGIVCGLGVGIGISLTVSTSGGFPMSLAVAFCLAGPVGIVLAQLSGRLATNNLEWFLMPVACVGLLPIVIGSNEVIVGCCAVLAFLYTLYELLHVIQLNEQMHEQPDIAPYIFAAGEGIFYIGVTVGWVANCILHILVGYSSIVFFVTVIVVVLLVVFVLAYVGRPSERTGHGAEAPPPSNAEQEAALLSDIAREAGLTARQTEIFEHLARGRNAPYIAEKLVVSYHTVKAHMYQIYRKLNVHTQQELIDLIEERMDS